MKYELSVADIKMRFWYKVSEVPDSTKFTMVFRPDLVRITIDGDYIAVVASGPRILKGGRLSSTQAEKSFWASEGGWPDWIKELVADAGERASKILEGS